VVSAAIPLSELHAIVQRAMGWGGGHQHLFETRDGTVYGNPDAAFSVADEDERRTRLDQVLRRDKDWIRYEYDFGDGWSHKIVLEKRLPPDPARALPDCLGGARACPPEDIGGVRGYYDFITAMADPAHPRHEELREWYDDDYDPEAFDPER
jgi:hypothetical protein